MTVAQGFFATGVLEWMDGAADFPAHAMLCIWFCHYLRLPVCNLRLAGRVTVAGVRGADRSVDPSRPQIGSLHLAQGIGFPTSAMDTAGIGYSGCVVGQPLVAQLHREDPLWARERVTVGPLEFRFAGGGRQ